MNTATQPQTTIPDGYLADARGVLWPRDRIQPIDIERDALAKDIAVKAQDLAEVIKRFKESVFADIDAFVDLSLERYDVKLGGRKGNLTITSFDGSIKVLRAVQESLTFDEGLLAAKQLIDECLQEWTENARTEVKALIGGAFEVDKQGNLNTKRILSLRRLKIDDERWIKAMDAISNAVNVQCSKSYVRVYLRDGNGDYQPVPLDVAGA